MLDLITLYVVFIIQGCSRLYISATAGFENEYMTFIDVIMLYSGFPVLQSVDL